MVQFTPETSWRPPDRIGRPPVEVPAQLSQWLDETYRAGVFCEIAARDDDPATYELLRAARIYCERKRLKLQAQFDHDGDSTILRFRMRDPRPYRRRRKR